MSAQPLFSVVVPSLDQGAFIRDAIESVLNQDYPALEVIVVDAGSSDETLDVLHDYDDDPRVQWTSEPDRGQSDAINKGWRRSRGEILSWLCADDGLYPGALSKVVDTFRANPGAGLVYGRGDILDLEGHLLHTSPLGPRDAWQLVHHENFICQPAAFATREALDAVGDVDVSLQYAMDWDLFVRLARTVPMVHTPDVLAWVRTYDDTKSIRGGHRRFREIVRVLRRYSEQRYPPSYFVFASHTYECALRRLLGRAPRPLEPVSERAAHLLGRAMSSIDARLRKRIGADNGWYRDGWAAPEVDRVVLGGERLLVIRGRLPAEYDSIHEQEIAVVVDGVMVARRLLDPGEFALELPLHEAPDAPVHRVRVEAQKWFVPRRQGLNDDRRRLAFYLEELDARPV